MANPRQAELKELREKLQGIKADYVYIDENATITRLMRQTLNTNQSLVWSRGGTWQVI